LPNLSPPQRLLLWCALGTAITQAILWAYGANPDRFSPIFFHLLKAFDTHGNLVLLAAALGAFFLRRQPVPAVVLRLFIERPWWIAAALFPLLCLGAWYVYHRYPLAMDEYVALFQAQAFAEGRLTGQYPPELLDRLVPPFFQGFFFTVSRATGEISSSYWPGFALLVAPFAALGIPWAVNPALGALTVPVLHRLVRRLGGAEAAGWAVALMLASPVFVVAGISYYPTAAHMLCNLLYALLLLTPTPARAAAAGLIGSLALTLHNPVPHLLFAVPFFVWLAWRPGRVANLAALVAGYLPIALLLGVGWHRHLVTLPAAAAAAPAGFAQVAPAVADTVLTQLGGFLKFPSATTLHARVAGLSKVWTWGAMGLLMLAAWSCRREPRAEIKVLIAALLVTFFGYFLVRFDQGHGWGYRYLHSAWFVLPVLAGMFLAASESRELRTMAIWGIVLSLVFAVGFRLVQVESFIARQIAQVPPLLEPARSASREVVFINLREGYYPQDMVQNDPFLRAPRLLMVQQGRESTAQFMARHFPGYTRVGEGKWGEHWRQKPAN
jgi:hypothetical protein